MFTYFMMYFISAYVAINNANKVGRSSKTVWIFIGIVLTIIIGLRHHVGGDWNNYLFNFLALRGLPFDNVMSMKDPGYQFLSYIAYDWGLSIYFVNLISAILFVSGLIALLRRQPNAWLGLAVAIPYLIIVVSMGYTRQGVAIGLVMWGIAYLDRGKFMYFIFFIFLAVTFHKSAILMIAFGMFQQNRGGIFKIAAIAVAGIGIWMSFVEESSAKLWTNYVEAEMESEGAIIRALLNFLPAVLLLVYRKEWKAHFNDYGLWVMVALASIASVGLVSFASTAVDRVALYFIPIQIVVFARLPFLAQRRISPKMTTILIVLFYALVMYVWLVFSANSRYWIPYRNILFMDLL